jgi:hypothetical protein
MPVPTDGREQTNFEVRSQLGQNYNIGRDQNVFGDVRAAVLERIREGPRILKALFVLGVMIWGSSYVLGAIVVTSAANSHSRPNAILFAVGMGLFSIGMVVTVGAGLAVMLRRRR